MARIAAVVSEIPGLADAITLATADGSDDWLVLAAAFAAEFLSSFSLRSCSSSTPENRTRFRLFLPLRPSMTATLVNGCCSVETFMLLPFGLVDTAEEGAALADDDVDVDVVFGFGFGYETGNPSHSSHVD